MQKQGFPIIGSIHCGTLQKLNMILLHRTAALFCYIVGEFRGYICDVIQGSIVIIPTL